MKRFLAIILALCLAVPLTACGGGTGGGADKPGDKTPENVTLKVWGAQEDQALLTQMVEAFKAENPDTKWDITLGVVSEADAKTKVLEDPAAAADVFAFANDQLRDLVKAGALYEVAGTYQAAATADNVSSSVDAATLDGKLWAFPMTADNGYFMYYDTSVISDATAESLDAILDAAQAAGKKVFMDVSNGWYIASFFLGAGCTLGLDGNGNQTCDFNSAEGVAAGEAIKALTAHPAFITGDDAVLTGGFADRSIVAAVSGVWNAAPISEALGDNYAASKLPTMTMSGAQVQMGSFGGYKLVGVNSQTASPEAAMQLAQWLTNEDNQLKRFNERQLGPSNTKVAENPEVLANKALAALAQQSAFAVSQNDVLGGYWEPAEAFGQAMENKDYSMPIQAMLDTMVEQIVSG